MEFLETEDRMKMLSMQAVAVVVADIRNQQNGG